jgi:myosin heavy subunit
MTEQQNQGDDAGQQQDTNEQQPAQERQQETRRQSSSQSSSEPVTGPAGEKSVPYYRFQEVNQERQQFKQRLEALEQQQQEREEQRAQKQGEFQQLAETRKKTIQQKDERIKELENQIVTDQRYRAFVGASQGVIIPEALDDAFGMLTEDDFAQASTEDPASYTSLAQQLADRKPYLAGGILRGAGSGGSAAPVIGKRNGSTGRTLGGGREPILKGRSKRKPPWK